MSIIAILTILNTRIVYGKKENYFEKALKIAKRYGEQKGNQYILSLNSEELILFTKQGCRWVQKNKPKKDWYLAGFYLAMCYSLVKKKKGSDYFVERMIEELSKSKKKEDEVWRSLIIRSLSKVKFKECKKNWINKIFETCKKILLDREESTIVRIEAADFLGMFYDFSLDFYLRYDIYRKLYFKKVGIREIIDIAKKRGLENPYREKIEEAIFLVLNVFKDRKEKEELRTEMGRPLHWLLRACDSERTRKEVQEELKKIATDKRTSAKIFMVSARLLVRIYKDKDILEEIKKRLKTIKDDELRYDANTLIQEFDKF